MRTVPDCLICILGDVYAAAQQVSEPKTALAVARAASDYLAANFDYELPPSYHITQVHRILKQQAELVEPFADRRRKTNDVGMEIAQKVAREAAEIGNLPGRLRYLALWALAANSLDSRTAGTGYAFDPAGAYDYLFGYFQRDPARDELDALVQYVAGGPRVLYIHDNVGELALDALLVRELRDSGCHVTSAVRGGPITSDATWNDALYVGLDSAASVLILAGPDTLGISFAEMSPQLTSELGRADLVIAKGQANYYVLSEFRNQIPGRVFAMFTVKCQAVARVLGVETRSAVCAFL